MVLSGYVSRRVLVALMLVCVSCSSPTPHADHVPRHGGIVLMYGDLHFEVVLDKGGRHRVYFSDAVRSELPASVASNVTITIKDQTGIAEILQAHIDRDGKSWVAEGKAVNDVNAMARVAFTARGKPYWIDLPFGFS